MSLPVLLSSCGGSGAPGQGEGRFVVTSTDPGNGGRVFLNQPVIFRFSNTVNLSTASFNSIAFTVRDTAGRALSETVTGEFSYGKNERGEIDSHSLEFNARLPTNDTFTNGGFKPGRIYNINLIGGNNPTSPSLRNNRGDKLHPESPIHGLTIRTVNGTTPEELFRDTKFGGPKVVSWEVGPLDSSGLVSLNRLGDLGVEIRLQFDQPLNPSSSNVPLRQDPDPQKFLAREKGRVFLEYDDAEFGKSRWIPALVELAANSASGALVVLRPDGVLPNNTEIRIIVESVLEDISGESNRLDPGYQRQIGTFETETAFEPQFDAVLLEFSNDDLLDPEASFRDPLAGIKDGMLTASFNFEGIDTPFNFKPTSKEVVLHTQQSQVQPSNGPPLTVFGGVFSFHDIEIPDGTRVQGVGPNPLVLLATGKVVISGVLSVDGGGGADVHTLNSANFPTSGGQGVCTGGNGGKASQEVTKSTPKGQTGWGPHQKPGLGGSGGNIACANASGRGGGGGGGSMSTQGDPDFYGTTSNIIKGFGGNGNGSGGAPGPLGFVDQNPENNFWGRQVDDVGNVIVGELLSPKGGAGGGGGGDTTSGSGSNRCDAMGSFINDRKGGGGGGAAGVLVVKALGPIIVDQKGRISADGGYGGGGEWAGASRFGGGGGGGAGGMVVLMSASRIELHTHGGRWHTTGNWDSNFSVSADGAHGRNTGFGGAARMQKYTGSGSPHVGAPNRGGFGGMGVVQLMTPPGDDQDDGTGTVQDDNIVFIDGQNILKGQAKTDYIFSGDIRPAPILMPVPFSRFSSARTRWIATGVGPLCPSPLPAGCSATVRRETTVPGARSVNASLGKSGPEYFFSGLLPTGSKATGYFNAQGYFKTDLDNGRLVSKVVLEADVTSVESLGAKVRGRTAHVVRLRGAPLPSPKEQGGWSYVNYKARLLDSGRRLAEYVILDHSKSVLFLDARDGALATQANEIEVVARFVDVFTGIDGRFTEGLGPVFDVFRSGKLEPDRYPIANVQLGFAFHKDPSRPALSAGGTEDSNRWPRKLSEFVHDLDVENTTLRDFLRNLHFPFVQVQVRFNLNFNPESPATTPGPNPVGPRSERTAIRVLRVPYRF